MSEDFKPRGPDFKGGSYAIWIEGDIVKLKHDGWAKAITLTKPRLQ